MANTYETLDVRTVDSGIIVVTLNRPEVRNAFNTQMGRDLRALFQPLQFTPGDVALHRNHRRRRQGVLRRRRPQGAQGYER